MTLLGLRLTMCASTRLLPYFVGTSKDETMYKGKIPIAMNVLQALPDIQASVSLPKRNDQNEYQILKHNGIVHVMLNCKMIQ